VSDPHGRQVHGQRRSKYDDLFVRAHPRSPFGMTLLRSS
jgi:hypothetical protein